MKAGDKLVVCGETVRMEAAGLLGALTRRFTSQVRPVALLSCPAACPATQVLSRSLPCYASPPSTLQSPAPWALRLGSRCLLSGSRGRPPLSESLGAPQPGSVIQSPLGHFAP